MNRDLRTVTGWIRAEWPGRAIPDAVHEAACRLAGPRRIVKAAKKERLAAKKESREERMDRVAEIRKAVFARAHGRCEFCRTPACTLPLEWHHIIGGGLRRHRESVETTATICRCCHREWEESNHLVLADAEAWAVGHGFTEALAAIRHRTAKVNEARAPRAAGAQP